MTALLLARARRAQSHNNRLEELHSRLAELETHLAIGPGASARPVDRGGRGARPRRARGAPGSAARRNSLTSGRTKRRRDVDETTEQNVIAVFENEQQAEQAASDLRGWDKANDDIKLGAIGMVEPG